jgi:hypothetical protein
VIAEPIEMNQLAVGRKKESTTTQKINDCAVGQHHKARKTAAVTHSRPAVLA